MGKKIGTTFNENKNLTTVNYAVDLLGFVLCGSQWQSKHCIGTVHGTTESIKQQQSVRILKLKKRLVSMTGRHRA